MTEAGHPSTSLMAVQSQVQIRDNGFCREKFARSGSIITGNMICAGGYQDACRGDSGGSLTCSRCATQYLLGIVSFGFRCKKRANKDLPGVYTDVTKYKDWIQRSWCKIKKLRFKNAVVLSALPAVWEQMALLRITIFSLQIHPSVCNLVLEGTRDRSKFPAPYVGTPLKGPTDRFSGFMKIGW